MWHGWRFILIAIPIGIFFLTLGSAVAAAIAIPSAGGVLIHAHRHRVSAGTLMARLLLVLSLAVLLVFTLPYWNHGGYVSPDSIDWNLVPFTTIIGQIRGLEYYSRESALQLLGNFGFFVIIGVLLPPSWRRARRFGVTLVVGLAITIAIELTQLVSSYLLPVWPRCADIDDVILNGFGVAVGWCFWRVGLALVRWANPG